ncbi:MAG: type II toxin-antitoxin system VapC family toxin [Dehalococcoidia bacterium]
MILTDAGPLVALIDRGERSHARCVATLATVSLPMVTTWPVFTEAMYLLGRGGWHAQDLLWQLPRRGDLVFGALDGPWLARVYALMEQYKDVPMDLADATLLALAEQRGLQRVFTLDSDFQMYRVRGWLRFDVIPS